MSTCRLCKSAFIKNWTARDAKTGENLDIAICGGCGLVQQSTVPSDEELKIYYSHNYRQDYKSTHQPKPKYIYRAGIAAQSRIDFMHRSGIQPSGKRLLDIGAGGGEFCYLAEKAGFAAQGIEPHNGYSEFAREKYGIQIHTCEIGELPSQRADVVTMFHVLEHLAHPHAAIQKIWDILAENGHFVVEVPNIHQTDSSPHNIYFKAHLFYYSRYSLMAATSQYFELIAIEDQHNLLMVFRKRKEPLMEMVLPSPAQINNTIERLEQKSWKQYLIEGGAWKKIILRIRKANAERNIKKLAARDILDSILISKQRRSPVIIKVGLITVIALTLETSFDILC